MQLLDRLAAHLAHLLNESGSDSSWIEPGAIYSDLLGVISTRYAGPLLYIGRYEWRMDAEEAAVRYFDATISRPLKLSGRSPFSSAHRAFLALVQRLPAPGWREAQLTRAHEAPRAITSVLIPAAAVEGLQARIGRLDPSVSSGNAAQSLRKRDGPLWLHAGTVAIEVPEEMSLWDAIVTIPPRVMSLPDGEAFNQFCGCIIDVMRTANRPVQEVLGLGHGLCPFDWLDVLSTSQVRSLRKYIAGLGEGRTLADLSPADALVRWQRQPVAGFATFDAFWNSEIVWAMRTARERLYQGEMDDLEVTEVVSDDDVETLTLNAKAWQTELNERVEAGLISVEEAMLLVRLYEGESLSSLEQDRDWRSWLLARGGVLQWVEELSWRIRP